MTLLNRSSVSISSFPNTVRIMVSVPVPIAVPSAVSMKVGSSSLRNVLKSSL